MGEIAPRTSLGGVAFLRVYLVDDHALMRAGLRSLLERDDRFRVVGESGDARHAIAEIGTARPDVVLLDISMPGMSGLDAIPRIKVAHPGVRIVMLTHHEGERFVEQALRAGADAYLSKDSQPDELAVAIESAHKGSQFLSPRVVGWLLAPRGARTLAHHGDDASAPLVSSRIDSLTPREREVFQLLAIGKSNKVVAKVLGMRLGTAKKHRENLQRKLDRHSSAELALLAMREGLLDG